MKTINIRGREYVEVSERIKYFREKFANYSLLTNLIELTEKRIVMKASIINDKGIEVANGIAYEDANSTFINKTSYIENCETSAWGRALANFGIGIESSVASADEIVNAIYNQSDEPLKFTSKKKPNQFVEKVKETFDGQEVEIVGTQFMIQKENKDLAALCREHKMTKKDVNDIPLKELKFDKEKIKEYIEKNFDNNETN